MKEKITEEDSMESFWKFVGLLLALISVLVIGFLFGEEKQKKVQPEIIYETVYEEVVPEEFLQFFQFNEIQKHPFSYNIAGTERQIFVATIDYIKYDEDLLDAFIEYAVSNRVQQ